MAWRNVMISAAMGMFVFSSATCGQVVRFRHQVTDLGGNVVDSVAVGQEFWLQTFTQQIGGYKSADYAGVYAGYLDISFDPALASVTGPITHGSLYSNGKHGDFSVPGLMDNMGGFSSSGALGLGMDPIGLDEQLLFSVPMRADSAGLLEFVGAESGEYPMYDVLVYSMSGPVPARDIDFGEEDLRIQFGRMSLQVGAVPEPSSFLLMAAGLGAVVWLRLRRREP